MEIKNLAVKLLKFQQEVQAIPKDATNPFFKSKYADINTFIEVIKPLLSKHGLVLIQPLTNVNGKPAIQTVLIDSESGESLGDTVILPENADPQKMGAIITYFRRYSLQSYLLLEAEDTDAQDLTKTVHQNFGHPQQPGVAPFATKTVGAKCSDCTDGKYVKSPKTGKVFCDKKCWTLPKVVQQEEPQGYEEVHNDEPPF